MTVAWWVRLSTVRAKLVITAQLLGRINRRNAPSLPTELIAPTGKAHARLQEQLGRSSQGDDAQKVDEELDPGILKP